MQNLFEPQDSCKHILLAIPSFLASMEAMIDTDRNPVPSGSPQTLMECVNENLVVQDMVIETSLPNTNPLDRELDMQDHIEEELDTEASLGDTNEAQNPETIPDKGEIDDSDDEAEPTQLEKDAKVRQEPPPSVKQLEEAMEDLEKLLRPPRCNKQQSYKDPGFNNKTIKRLEAMKLLCFNVLELERKKAPGQKSRGIWTAASVTTARSLGYSKKNSLKPGLKKAKDLRRWLRMFIDDHEEVPTCNWSTSGRSLIDDEDFAQEIHAHLQTLGPYVSAEAIVRLLDTPDMLARLHRKKTISLTTAQRWMKKMGYQWSLNPKGQYVDGLNTMMSRSIVTIFICLQWPKSGNGHRNMALGTHSTHLIQGYGV